MENLPDSLSDTASLFNGSSSSSTQWCDVTINTNELTANVAAWETSTSGFAITDFTDMASKSTTDITSNLVSTVDTSM